MSSLPCSTLVRFGEKTSRLWVGVYVRHGPSRCLAFRRCALQALAKPYPPPYPSIMFPPTVYCTTTHRLRISQLAVNIYTSGSLILILIFHRNINPPLFRGDPHAVLYFSALRGSVPIKLAELRSLSALQCQNHLNCVCPQSGTSFRAWPNKPLVLVLSSTGIDEVPHRKLLYNLPTYWVCLAASSVSATILKPVVPAIIL